MPVLVTLLAAMVAACAGPAESARATSAGAAAKVHRGQGDKLLVRLYDARHEVRLELANESNPDLADAYSELRKTATLKLAPDDLMADLLKELDQDGFDKLASDGRPPEPPPGRGWVEVRRGSSSRTFVVPADAAATPEQLGAFVHMKLRINEYFTHLGAMQYLDNPQGAAIFKGKGT